MVYGNIFFTLLIFSVSSSVCGNIFSDIEKAGENFGKDVAKTAVTSEQAVVSGVKEAGAQTGHVLQQIGGAGQNVADTLESPETENEILEELEVFDKSDED